ncbi:MAG: hypothetical protein ABIY37_16650 [Devosia sp.]
MGALIGIFAIICNFVGVVLMVRYGLPNSLPLLGRSAASLTETDMVERDRRGLYGVIGLVLFASGSALQIMAGAAR